MQHSLGYFVVRVNPYGKFHRLLDHDCILHSDIREYDAALCGNADTMKKLRGTYVNCVLHTFRIQFSEVILLVVVTFHRASTKIP
jgi:hypothetical protein